MFDVITIGSATRDVFLASKGFMVKRDKSSVTDVDLVLPLGSKIEVENIIFETGGGATNAAVTFTRQGLKTAAIARLGEDPGGRAVRESLEKEGIDVSLIKQDTDNNTGYSIILVTESGARTILVYRGASAYFSEGDISLDDLKTKWIFISSLAGNVRLLAHLVSWADKHNVKTAVIPGGGELSKGSEVLAPIFTKADVVIMNREEAAGLTGIEFDKKEEIVHEMCLLTRGVGVITDAQAGATACDREYFYHIGAHSNPAVERTGAGDAFASGFVAGLMKFEHIEGALELAADNASSVVNYFGAKKGVLHSGEKPFRDKLEVQRQRSHEKYSR